MHGQGIYVPEHVYPTVVLQQGLLGAMFQVVIQPLTALKPQLLCPLNLLLSGDCKHDDECGVCSHYVRTCLYDNYNTTHGMLSLMC